MAVQTFALNESDNVKRRFHLMLVDANDGFTPETGEDGGQPQISINGSSFDNTSGLLNAVGNGLYYVELTQSELGALGHFVVRYKSANTAEFQDVGYIEEGSGVTNEELKQLLLKILYKLNWIEYRLGSKDDKQDNNIELDLL